MRYEVKVTRKDVFFYEVEASCRKEAIEIALDLNTNEDDLDAFDYCESRRGEILS